MFSPQSEWTGGASGQPAEAAVSHEDDHRIVLSADAGGRPGLQSRHHD